MKKIKFLIATAIFAAMGILEACHENIIDRSNSQVDNDPESPFRAAMINTDAASKEVMKIITANKDTLVYYGNKNQDGTVLDFYTVEYISYDGASIIIDLNDNGEIASIYNNSGTSISFEWITKDSAIVNAHSQEQNYYISTALDFTNLDNTVNAPTKTKVIPNMVRDEKLRLEIRKGSETWSDVKDKAVTRVQYDPDNYPFSCQEVWLWIYQCSSSFDAKNYLIVKNATNGFTISKLMNPEYMIKGNYRYLLPKNSYPTSATNKQLCNSIDNALINFEQGLGNVLLASDELVIALNSVAFALAPYTEGASLGLAAISSLIVGGAKVFDCVLQLANQAGGVSALMKWASSEWYYKEYIISDLTLTPVGYTQTKTVMGEPHRVTPDDYNNILVTLDMQGDPVINSFSLNPSHPGQHVSYTAIADYHCIPENSTITLSIVGTDGYSNSITEKISDSGSAVLYVPGAERGVYDLCTVIINMPFGETLKMEASLVFGN